MRNLERKDSTFKGDFGACMEFEAKLDASEGSFEGFASVYGNVDQGGDIVQAGAFKSSFRKRPINKVKMLLHHDTRQLVGVWEEVKSNDEGLFVTGQLLLKTRAGQETHELMKAGALDGLSIGFRTIEDSFNTEKGIRTIVKADLMEISLVTFPMNEQATISSVKAVHDIKTIRDFEKYLRDGGFSSNAAKGIAQNGFKQSDLPGEADEQQGTVDALNQLTQMLCN